MKIKQLWLSIILLCFTAFAFAQATNVPANAPFPKTLDIGGKTWRLDNYQEDNNLQLGEYVTGSDNVKNWQELLTFQKFKFAINKEITPKMFADKEIEELKKQNQRLKVESDILSSSDKEAVMEFRISAPKSDQQDEIQRIIFTPDRQLIIVHYVVRKPDMGPDARKIWQDAITNFDTNALGATTTTASPSISVPPAPTTPSPTITPAPAPAPAPTS